MFSNKINSLIASFNKLQAQADEAVAERDKAIQKLDQQRDSLSTELVTARNISKMLKSLGLGGEK